MVDLFDKAAFAKHLACKNKAAWCELYVLFSLVTPPYIIISFIIPHLTLKYIKKEDFI